MKIKIQFQLLNYFFIILLTAIITINSQEADIKSQYQVHYWPQPQKLQVSPFDMVNNIQLTGKYMSYELVRHRHNRNLQVKINDIFDLYYEKLFHLNSQDKIKAERMQNVKTGKNIFNVSYDETGMTYQPPQQGELKVFINIINANDYSNESYTLDITNQEARIQSHGYTGFVRALQTLSQSIISIQNNQTFQLQNLPISISDWNEYEVRGIMLDCSTSYIQISSLKEYIDSLMFNKLNTLVINVVGLGPIRLQIQKDKQEYETYTDGELLDLIAYGKTRGIKVILGIESQNGYQLDGSLLGADVICKSQLMPFQGQLNLTNEASLELLKSVVDKAGKISEEMVYIGGKGNTLQQNCDQDITIGRKQACAYLKQLHPEKKCMAYIEARVEDKSKIEKLLPNDSIQMVGLNSNENVDVKQPSIILNHDLDLHEGVAPSWASRSNTLINWRSYENQEPHCSDKKLCLGGLLLLEYQTGLSLGVRTWIRATIWAQSLWNPRPIDLANSGQLRRLARIERRLNQWGVRNEPYTCEYCTLNQWDCF